MLAPLAACFMLLSGRAAAQGAVSAETPILAKEAPAVDALEQSPAGDAPASPVRETEAQRNARRASHIQALRSGQEQVVTGSREQDASAQPTIKVDLSPEKEQALKEAEAAGQRAAASQPSEAREKPLVPVANIHGEEVTEPN